MRFRRSPPAFLVNLLLYSFVVTVMLPISTTLIDRQADEKRFMPTESASQSGRPSTRSGKEAREDTNVATLYVKIRQQNVVNGRTGERYLRLAEGGGRGRRRSL